MALEPGSILSRLARLFGGREPTPTNPPSVVADPEAGGRPLVGQHISEIRKTAAANGWTEAPLLTFTPARNGRPIRFETDTAGVVTLAAWAKREPEPRDILAERLLAAWMERVNQPYDLCGLGPMAVVAVEVFVEWLTNPPADLVGGAAR